MGLLGNTPEKRKRSKLALLWGSSLIVCYLGIWLESTILIILSVILILTTALMNIIVYRKQYYSSLKEIRGTFYKGSGKTLPKTPYDEALKEMETNKKTRERIHQEVIEDKRPVKYFLSSILGILIIIICGSIFYTSFSNGGIQFGILVRLIILGALGISFLSYGLYNIFK